MALTQLLSRIEDSNINEHRKTREMIKERVRKREESLSEEIKAYLKKKAEEEKAENEAKKEPTKKKFVFHPELFYDQEDLERRKQFWDSPESASMKVDNRKEVEVIKRIFGKPEAVDVTMEEEQSVRFLVHTKILKSLNYPTMKTRYEDVAEAYPKTFRWLFDDSTTPVLTSLQSKSERSWSSFTDWLQSGSGVYWINGKAASGKSTLMRYIYDNRKTREYIQRWTREAPLCVATFFFWNSGSSEQKSQSGLLRALLYQVLERYPEVTPIVFPSLWARIYSQTVRCLDVEEEIWSIPKLRRAFDTLIKQNAIAMKLFFLIDGLDEFEANQNNQGELDYEEMCGLFKDIASFTNIKVCLSSRPWVVFEDSFCDSSSLKLQNLTRGDIEHYTTSKFQNSNSFKRLAQQDPEAAKQLIFDVVDKSDGVFLWVKVVVRDLLNGLMNHDEFQDLQRRLNWLPRDLEALYDHMLKRTDPRHHGSASEIFQIYWTCQHHRDNVGPEDSIEPLTALALYLATNADKLGLEGVMSLQEHDLELRCKETGLQLTARCAGLLEVSPRKRSSTWANMNHPIHYMHRTARDFIERPEIWKELLSRTEGTSFNPYEVLMKSSILQLSLIPTSLLKSSDGVVPKDCKWSDERTEHLRWIERTATSAMIYAHFTESQINKANLYWLDRLDQMMTKLPYLQRQNYHWSNQDFFRLSIPLTGRAFCMRTALFCSFLAYAVQFGLAEYVDEKLKELGKIKGYQEGTSLLQYAVRCPLDILRFPHSSKVVSLLLRHGENPNETYLGHSPWEEVLNSVHRGDILNNAKAEGYRREQQLEYIKIIECLIQAGANPQAYIKDEEGVLYTALSILCAVKRRFPEAAQLEEELKRRGGKETVSKRQWFKKLIESVERNASA